LPKMTANCRKETDKLQQCNYCSINNAIHKINNGLSTLANYSCKSGVTKS